jgi:hypothetical protein
MSIFFFTIAFLLCAQQMMTLATAPSFVEYGRRQKKVPGSPPKDRRVADAPEQRVAPRRRKNVRQSCHDYRHRQAQLRTVNQVLQFINNGGAMSLIWLDLIRKLTPSEGRFGGCFQVRNNIELYRPICV